MSKRVILISPHGFCVGVARAVNAVEAAIKKYGTPLYCYHAIVHNQQILDEMRDAGVVFVETIAEVPEGGVLVFSAHGMPPEALEEARQRKLRIVDATCPFVRKVHLEVKRYAREGRMVFLIGHKNHQEVIGVSSEAPGSVMVLENEDDAHNVMPPDPERVGVVTQTTLSYHDTNHILSVLLARFPELQQPQKSDICYATQNRQAAVREVASEVERIIVLGGTNSSNSKRLVEVAAAADCGASLVSSMTDFQALDLDGIHVLGVTSGASTPETFLEQVMEQLALRGFTDVEERSVIPESPSPFKLPPMP